MIEENQVGGDRCRSPSELVELAFADQGSGVRAVAALQKFSSHLRARTGGQRAQLVERFFRGKLRNRRGFGGDATIACRLGPVGQRFFAGARTSTVFNAHQERPFPVCIARVF